jgi:shikimate dehydrogenase
MNPLTSSPSLSDPLAPDQADLYAVIGHPVHHSLSPRIHALFAAQCGQQIRYEALEAPRDGFAQSLRQLIARGAQGANVTIPFKGEAYALADQHTARAHRAQAVNTLQFTPDGRIFADNTDGIGLVRDLGARGVPLRGQRIALLGAGGAACGVWSDLLACDPAALTIANRSAEKARLLAHTARCASPGLPCPVLGGGFDLLVGERFDLVINATASGLSGSPLPLPEGIFAPGATAYELLYGQDTPFMIQARAAGARAVDGLGMLVEQACVAFTLWRGVCPDTAPVLAALRSAHQP